jgi:hypothetical protein
MLRNFSRFDHIKGLEPQRLSIISISVKDETTPYSW